MSDVAIIGIGMHKFGRTPELNGVDQGARCCSWVYYRRHRVAKSNYGPAIDTPRWSPPR